MEDKKEYVLCGGTFFTLLLRARKQRIAARRNAEGESDGLSDQDVFEGLLKVAFPNFVAPAGSSFKTYTSNYKACRLSSNEYLPFENSELINNWLLRSCSSKNERIYRDIYFSRRLCKLAG